jgi:hypothetical protein
MEPSPLSTFWVRVILSKQLSDYFNGFFFFFLKKRCFLFYKTLLDAAFKFYPGQKYPSWTWARHACKPVILVLGRLRKENCKFEASLDTQQHLASKTNKNPQYPRSARITPSPAILVIRTWKSLLAVVTLTYRYEPKLRSQPR